MKKKLPWLALGIATLTLSGLSCSSLLKRNPAAEAAANDPYLWLEEVDSPRALDWARAQNERTLPRLISHPRHAQLQEEIRKIATATDRIPYPELQNGWAYNFWQDATHIRGIWRRATLKEFQKKDPKWEVLLDLDELSRKENESWVFDGARCLPPEGERCLLLLSRGGKDASVVREFNVATRAFVTPEQGGYFLPEAKSRIQWLDANSVFVGTDFGPGSLTDSGYPRLVKLWKRGTPLAQAKLIMEGEKTDVSVQGFTYYSPEGRFPIIYRGVSFFEYENHLFDAASGKLTKLPFPRDSRLYEIFQGQLIAKLKKPWKTATAALPEGAVISLPLANLGDPDPTAAIQVIFAPDARSSVAEIFRTRQHLYLKVLDNVRSKVLEAVSTPSGWHYERVELPDHGAISLVSSDPAKDQFMMNYQSFLTPPSLYLLGAGKPKAVKTLPPRFEAKNLLIEQLEAASADGTKIPYFVVRPKNLPFDGKAPTVLYAYGGFEASSTPYYSGVIGKAWLEKGGVYVLANIRGGGEFGPKWHQAALKENRQRAFDDFIAVAEDLIRRKITGPRNLGIWGGSNGGLLVGAAFVQRPELFNAVMCGVPLLDMLRYHKLLAGSSWIGEYGDPEDLNMALAIEKYSPYQNVRKAAKYPQVFFLTSTRDDRVHPAHARKMAARMREQGHEIFYYENIEGGHGGSADLEQRIRKNSLEFTYFHDRLSPAR